LTLDKAVKKILLAMNRQADLKRRTCGDFRKATKRDKESKKKW